MENNLNNTPPSMPSGGPSGARIWNFAIAVILIALGGAYLRDSKLVDPYHFKAVASLALGVALLVINIKYKK